MSKGLGRIERQALDALRYHGILTTHEIADTIAGHGQASRTLDASVRRACAGLRRKGVIDSLRAGRHMHWYIPDSGDRREGGGAGFADAAMRSSGIADADRQRLVRLLGMLGSAHEGERANAASLLERERQRLGLTWEDIMGR